MRKGSLWESEVCLWRRGWVPGFARWFLLACITQKLPPYLHFEFCCAEISVCWHWDWHSIYTFCLVKYLCVPYLSFDFIYMYSILALFWENMLLLVDVHLRHDLNRMTVIQNRNCLEVFFLCLQILILWLIFYVIEFVVWVLTAPYRRQQIKLVWSNSSTDLTPLNSACTAVLDISLTDCPHGSCPPAKPQCFIHGCTISDHVW